MQSDQGKLLGIAVRRYSRAPMQEVDIAEVSKDHGVANDFRGKTHMRQVTVLSAEDWQAACEQLGRELPWTCRRANLLVEGIALKETTGSTIVLGKVTLVVTGETDPCSRMDQIEPGLQMALAADWRGGVCCRVIRGGTVTTGMPATIQSPKE